MNSVILVVDDERQIRRALSGSLTNEGYVVMTADTGEAALETIEKSVPDLVLLDLALPGMSGLEVCRALRAHWRVPIIVLSALITERDKVAALDLGADDYLTKPFGIEELLARVRAHLRRWHGETGEPQSRVVFADNVRIDLDQPVVTVAGEEVKLTRTQHKILAYLAAHAGRVVTHGMIQRQVWGQEHQEDLASLRVHIALLRRKIETEPARPRLVRTELGVGYRFVIPE